MAIRCLRGMNRVSQPSRKRLLLCAGALWLPGLILLLSAGCRTADGAWPGIESSGVLRLGIDPTFPPFGFVGPSGLEGLDVDLAHAVASTLGLRAEFVHLSYDALYDALSTGQVDVLISALIVAPERTRDFAYSQSYFDAGETLFFLASNSEIAGMETLSGRLLAVELGAQGHVEATAWSRRVTDLEVMTYNSGDEAMTAVLSGEADAALVDAVTGRLFTMTRPGLQRGIRQVTSEPYAMVVRQQDSLLLEKLDSSLEGLRSSGQLQQIVEKWLGE